MKFLKLEILHLASLDKREGEVINFEEGALGESTIFSIVGPTGSGKSTILDAICLALYNRAPRYPRKKNDKDKVEIYGDVDNEENNRLAPTDGRNILSRGKKIGYSKLTFLANNGDVYRAEWHVQKARVKYNSVVTLLYKLVRTEDTWQEEICTWTDLPQIIGLDYEQFLRTVLIAQGSFANFLTAKENERYELLEKLVGCGDMYTRIAEEIKQKREASMAAYNEIKAEFEAYEKDDLTPEELLALNRQIEELEEEERKQHQELELVGKALMWYADEDKFLENIHRCEEVLTQAKAALDDMKERTERLALHDATLQAVGIYKEKKSKEDSLRLIARNLQILSEEVARKNTDMAAEEEKLQALKVTFEQATLHLSEQKPKINGARIVKVQWETARTAEHEKKNLRENAVKERDAAKKKLEDNLANINKLESSLSGIQKQYDELKELVDQQRDSLKKQVDEAVHAYEQEWKQLEGKKLEDLLQAKERAMLCLQDLREAIRIQHGWKEKEELKKRLEEDGKKLSERNEAIENECGKHTIGSLGKELEVLKKAYTLVTSLDWKKQRQSLVEGEPCPLCGARNHPFLKEEEYEPFVSDMDEQIRGKEAELNRQTEQEKILQKELNENKGKLDTLAARLDTLHSEIARYASEWGMIAEKHTDWKADEDSLKAMQQPMEDAFQGAQKELDEYHAVCRKVEELRVRKERKENEQKDYGEKSDQKLKELENRKTDAVTALATEKGKTENFDLQCKEKEEALLLIAEEEANAQALVRQKSAELKELIGDKDPDALEKQLTDALDAAHEAVKKKEKQIADLKEQCAGLNGRIQNQKELQLQEGEAMEEKNVRLLRWLEDYHADESHVQKLEVEDIIALSEATDRWEDIRQEKERKNHAHTSAYTTYKNQVEAHQAHQQVKPSEEKESLLIKKQQLEEKDRSALINAKAKLQRYQIAKKEMGAKYEQKQQTEQVMKDWSAISEAIGGAEGKLLRKIAQCYTLRFLVEHANAEIRKFNSRYELVQVKNSLAIRVIDHDRADDVRDTTSLSGGETFIVSLGLALGLSALSSRSISFGNLFIDEGFGTLDPDTLATVIDSLAMLQTSQGKKVGVISHTDTMSERITTQIRVIKNGHSGSSHIEIYP